MMGDRDYRSIIRNALDSLGRELQTNIDAKDASIIHLEEAVKCLRRSYYDRKDPIEEERRGFNELLTGLLTKMGYGPGLGTFDLGGLTLHGSAQLVSDEAVMLFRPAADLLENPRAEDMLYLNACMWIYDKRDGILIYITGDRRESSFSLTRNKAMFEETIRRVRVFADMIQGDKVPILEPSEDCEQCQYYTRCYARKRETRPVTLAEILGLGKSPD